METSIGTPEQWKEIFERRPALAEAINALIDFMTKDSAKVQIKSHAEEVIFALSRVCVEECWEILLLAANKYGNGALKLLRGLYERALTLTYISKFPEKAERFYKYSAIQEHRTFTHTRKAIPLEALAQAFSPQVIERIEENYRAAKAEFQRTKCKTCDTKELAHSWDIDIASMAEKTGELFPSMLLSAYRFRRWNSTRRWRQHSREQRPRRIRSRSITACPHLR